MDRKKDWAFAEELPPLWRERLQTEVAKKYFKSLTRFLVQEYNSHKPVHPKREWVLRALQMVDYDRVRVVILGQDPYHGEDQAIGLSFAVPNDLFPKPPSLLNIFKELKSDLGIEVPKGQSDLTGWAEQGVLLLNAVLTVRSSEAFSHREAGWEHFTDRVISEINQRMEPVVFVLWGAAAQKKKALITNPWHFVLESAHPSPLSASRGFFGSRPFSKVNELLEKKIGQKPIDWSKISNAKA
ncbi:MAG: uracil-DNA glycosylase [Oligoflexia bacterium]|nr:uracil-DNA glycosylase [Oligoflexia bacterium]